MFRTPDQTLKLVYELLLYHELEIMCAWPNVVYKNVIFCAQNINSVNGDVKEAISKRPRLSVTTDVIIVFLSDVSIKIS